MSVVIKKLTHPNSLTHQYYKQKWMKFFLVGFIEREREIKFSAFQGLFFQNFLTFFFAPLIFLTFPSLFLYFSLFFSKMGRIFRANDEMGGQHNCNMLHLCQPPIFANSSAYFVFFFFFLFRFSCSCLEAFLSSIFFKLYMLRKLWMSGFQQSLPRLIWSYGRRDIVLGRKVMQS